MRTNGEGGQNRAEIAGETQGKRVGGTTGAFPAFQLALSFSLSLFSLSFQTAQRTFSAL